MLRYRFQALTYDGKTEGGVIDGDSIGEVRQILKQKQLVPVRIYLEREWVQQNPWLKWALQEKPLSRSELTLLTKQLSILIKSGIQVDVALGILSNETHLTHFKKVLNAVIAELHSGLPFSKAIASQPESFDSMYQGVIGAAESSGNMSAVLAKLATFLEKRQALRQKAIGALAYPAMLTLVSAAIILFLMIHVVPQIARVFDSAKQQLPLSTQFVLGLSDVLLNWGWLILLLIGIASYGCARALKNPSIRMQFDGVVLKTPLIGPLHLCFETARFAGTLAMLSTANVPLLTALQGAKNTITNVKLQLAIDTASLHIREGVSFSRALASQAIFSPILIHLIRAGESSGQLAEMLAYAAENAELEAEQKTKVVTSLLEPILILMMGLAVLGIVMAVMQPILEMNTGLG